MTRDGKNGLISLLFLGCGAPNWVLSRLLGLPVIACDTGPIPELVGGEAALLVPPDDAGALREALNLLLEDSALRGRMSAAAYRRASHLPRWEETVAAFRRVLEEAFVSPPTCRSL